MAHQETCPDCGSINCVEFDVSRGDEMIQGRDCELWTRSFRCDRGHEFMTTEYHLPSPKLVEMLETVFNFASQASGNAIFHDETTGREIPKADVAAMLSTLIPERRQHYRDVADQYADDQRAETHTIPDSHFICNDCGDMDFADKAVQADGEWWCHACFTKHAIRCLMSKRYGLADNDYEMDWFDLDQPIEEQADAYAVKYDLDRIDLPFGM